MNSPASFVKSLLAQCCLGGICEWVVCPGARNVALLQVLAAAEDLVKWTHFDERSAAFFALGRIQDMGLPVAVVTTSGTAAAELLPAVVEAYYQRRPLLLLTADRPAACRGSAAPQAIEQVDLFGIYAPTIDLETPESLPEDILQDWDYASPLHINVCLPDPDPAWNPGICDLYPAEPPEENGFRGSLAELARALRFKSRDGLVVMIGGLDPTEQAPARWLANELKAPVVADATSGLREELAHLALTDADALLREHPPAVLLRLGDVPVARFWRDLEDIPATEVFSVTRRAGPPLHRRHRKSGGYSACAGGYRYRGRRERTALHEQTQKSPDGGTAHHLPGKRTGHGALLLLLCRGRRLHLPGQLHARAVLEQLRPDSHPHGKRPRQPGSQRN